MFSNTLCSIFLLVSFVHASALHVIPGGVSKRHHANIALMRRGETSANHAPGTNYDVTTAESACGDWPKPSDFVVAMNSPSFQGSCHKPITITYGNKQTTAKIVDECPTCWPHGIDMSDGLFEFFAPLSVGLIYVDWFIGEPQAAPPPPPKTTTHHTNPTPTTSHHTSSSSISHKPSSSSKPASSSAPTPTGNIQALYQAVINMGDVVVVGAKTGSSTK